MSQNKREHAKEKTKLHARNKHRERYDFAQLIATCPELARFVAVNQYGDEAIDFFNAEAVKALNKALLQQYYGITFWDFPKDFLCAPIPGRADYIHHIADILGKNNNGKIPTGKNITCLDIGVGSNCIYPIIGNQEYGWTFIGTDIDPISIDSARKIVEGNTFLQGKIEIRLQKDPKVIFGGIFKKDERVDFSICNPPYHTSLEESQAGSIRKLRNLKGRKVTKPVLNFGGQNNELWCEGGEVQFVQEMIVESKKYAGNCLWFSTLISKESNLPFIYEALYEAKVFEMETLPMGQGNKQSRIVVWTFMNEKQQKIWMNARW